MSNRWIAAFLATLIGMLMTASGRVAQAQNLASTPRAASRSTANRSIVVPTRTTIPLELRASLSSRTARVGQRIYCDTVYPIVVNNRVIIPAGSYVKGTITQVVRPGRVKGKAQMGLRFDSITLPSGITHGISATLSGFAGNGKEGFSKTESKVEGEGSKGKDAATVAISGAEAATIGAIAGSAGGHAATAASVGGAMGALGGLVYVLATRGKDIVLPAGTNLELELLRPLSFYPDEINTPTNMPAGPAFQPRDPGPGI